MAVNRADIRNRIRSILDAWPARAVLDSAMSARVGENTFRVQDSAEINFMGPKALLEIESEVLQVFDIPEGATSVKAMRGRKGSTVATHAIRTDINVYPSWGWTDYELNNYILPDSFRWLRPHAWIEAETSDFTWAQDAREATPGSSISYPDGNAIIKVQDKQSSVYYPFSSWQLVGSKLFFRNKAATGRTLRCVYAKFQAPLTDDTTALDNDQFAECIAKYAAFLCLDGLKTSRVRYAEYSASLNDRASTVDEIIRMGFDLKNQAILSRDENSRPMPATFASTYKE